MSLRFSRPVAAMAMLLEAFAFLFPWRIVTAQEWQPVASAQPQAAVFSDVSGSALNSDAIRYLKDQKIVTGYGDGTFKPERKINRAEFTKIVVESLGKTPEKRTNCFLDVRDEWFSSYVCTAKAEGWIGGYPDGSFRPSNDISFVEAAKIVGKAYGRAGGAGETWYEPYVKTLEAGKAIPLSISDFDQKITRAEMSELIYRIKANVRSHASRTYDELKGVGTIRVSSCQELFERMQLPQIATLEGKLIAPVEAAMFQGDVGEGKGGGGGYTPAAPFTTTNMQVPGVDEGDIVKTDGDYIYVAKADTVRIVQAVPPSALKEIATVKLPLDPNKGEYFSVTELYANGTQLVVSGTLSAPYLPFEGQKIIAPWQYNPVNRILIFDTTKKSSPKLLRSVSIQGNPVTSRRIGNTLYSVNALWSYGPYSITAAAAPEMTGSGTAGMAMGGGGDYSTISGATIMRANVSQSEVIPTITDSKDGVTRPMAHCQDVVLFPKIPSTNFISVSAIPLNDLTKDVSTTMMVADSNASYVSATNLYLSSTDWSQVRGDLRSSEKTTVYKFSMADSGAKFVGYGAVPGSVLNQWSMDEYQGNLRIATTRHSSIGQRQYTAANVYVLNDKMALVGQTRDLAPNEQAHAVLFMGDKGIVATYRQIDPLFTLDLSNPSKPEVKGALKIPGQPQYALEWDDDHVITFGSDDAPVSIQPVAEGTTVPVPAPNVGGVKMALYNISDLSNPREVQNVVIGQSGSTTEATWNHKALLVDRERGLLAFPVTESGWTTQATAPQDKCATYSYDQCPVNNCQKTCVPSSCTTENGVQVCTPDCNGAGSCKSWGFVPDPSTGGGYTTVWQGAYVYDVAPTGFKLKGKVTHFTDADKDPVNGQMQWWGNKAIQRILRIGDSLYTVSLGMVKALALPNLTEVKSAVIVGD